MAEYLIFIHGVNTRDIRDQPRYADYLFQNIERLSSPGITIKSIPLYWGDVNLNAEQQLMKSLEESHVWDQLHFQDFRAKQLLQFTGDAALYISRAIGKQVVEHLIQDAMLGLQSFQSGDHIHLITHSMGTIILFDVLFSPRWDAPNAGGFEGVEQLRHLIFRSDSPLQSIHTMGSLSAFLA
jgi:hypothetical protein